MPIDPVTLTQELIRFETVNPPGDEATCAAHLAALLERSGFTVEDHAFGPRRTSLVAHCPGHDLALAPLVLTGHLDTVPLGAQPWSVSPFGAEIRDGRLYGRGASDMKAGVAAALSAAAGAANGGRLRRGVTLVLTAGEETGCEGARHLAGTDGALGEANGLIVAEPTNNRLVIAHKGALHLQARTTGKTAHGSMPHLGDNAVTKAVRAIAAVEAHRFEEQPHPLLGAPTLAVTSVHGGENVNSVPDACAFTLDIRTIPGMDHTGVLARLRAALAPDVTLEPALADLGPVGTDLDHPFVRCVQQVVARHAGEQAATPAGMPYFTDGSILQRAYQQCPTVIVGPGEPGQAHQTDEFCTVDNIVQAASIYRDVIEAWCGA